MKLGKHMVSLPDGTKVTIRLKNISQEGDALVFDGVL